MSGTVRILSVSRGFFRDKITVQAVDDCEAIWDSLMGPRQFFLRKNDRRRVCIGKMLFEKGEVVSFTLVCTAANAFSYAWRWYYGTQDTQGGGR